MAQHWTEQIAGQTPSRYWLRRLDRRQPTGPRRLSTGAQVADRGGRHSAHHRIRAIAVPIIASVAIAIFIGWVLLASGRVLNLTAAAQHGGVPEAGSPRSPACSQ